MTRVFDPNFDLLVLDKVDDLNDIIFTSDVGRQKRYTSFVAGLRSWGMCQAIGRSPKTRHIAPWLAGSPEGVTPGLIRNRTSLRRKFWIVTWRCSGTDREEASLKGLIQAWTSRQNRLGRWTGAGSHVMRTHKRKKD